MRLADAIADTTPPPPKPGKVEKLLDLIDDPDDRAEMEAMLLDPKWTHIRLCEILYKLTGETVGDTTLSKWRRPRMQGAR